MSDLMRIVRPEVAGLSAYNAGMTLAELKARYDPPEVAKLGSNENPLGPSPRVLAALTADADLFRLYPDPSGRSLAAAIAGHLGVDAEQVVLGNGSEDLIAVVCRTVLSPGDRVVTLYPSFPLHEDYARLMGATVERVEVGRDLTVDVDALVAAVGREPKLVMFANPLNPVGSWLSPDDMRRVVAALSPRTLLVVDEAYAEYAEGEDYASAIGLLAAARRPWLVLRTLSKAYGLAGLRIGYGVAASPDLVSFLDRARTPFNTNAVAQAAGRTALSDRAHLAASVALARAERARMAEQLSARGLRVAPSAGNFLFVDTGRESAAVAEALLRHGVIVKPWRQEGYRSFIRVSAGAPRENDLFLAALDAVMAAG